MGRALPIPPFLVEEWRFLRGLAQRPRSVGAIAPSSPALARTLAAQIPANPGPVLELGPGTGVVTEAILAQGVRPERLTAVEYDEDFARHLTLRFPRVRIVRGDAFDLGATLGPVGEHYAAVVSGLPLLNHPAERRDRLLADVFDRLAPGAPFIQFSYGVQPPVPPTRGVEVRRAAFILFNLPPARVWVYRRL